MAVFVDRPLPYCRGLEARDPATIDLVVLHCTELPDLTTARRYGEKIHFEGSGTGVSGHYYIDRTGDIERWVEESRVAHHCIAYNQRSVGIELVNAGRYPHWFDSRHQQPEEPYGREQLAALEALLAHLRQALPALTRLARHSDLDRGRVAASDDPRRQVRRKIDPGPLFPWSQVLARSGLQALSAD
ncbi:MAG: N-acetylmuramoyl-L-alanine amidase [Acidobacteriota bacterium]